MVIKGYKGCLDHKQDLLRSMARKTALHSTNILAWAGPRGGVLGLRSMALTQSYYSWDSIWLLDSTALLGSLVAAWLTMPAGRWKGKGTLVL